MSLLCRARNSCVGLAVFSCLAAAAQAVRVPQKVESSLNVPASVATEHLVKGVDPAYPKIAVEHRVQGTVVLKATITPEGQVTNLVAVSGHPILIAAALDAVRRWQYQPFIVDGRLTAVNTTIQVEFSLAPGDYKKEAQAAEAYFKQADKCRALVNAAQYVEAEPVCRQGIELVQKLDASRILERVAAYRLAGYSLVWQKKYAEALSLYQRELAAAESGLRPDDAELGYAYHDVAVALDSMGELNQARPYYEKGETTLEQAREHIGSEFLKNRYSAVLKELLMEYALLLQRSGDESGANAAEAKANAIVVRTDLKQSD